MTGLRNFPSYFVGNCFLRQVFFSQYSRAYLRKEIYICLVESKMQLVSLYTFSVKFDLHFKSSGHSENAQKQGLLFTNNNANFLAYTREYAKKPSFALLIENNTFGSRKTGAVYHLLYARMEYLFMTDHKLIPQESDRLETYGSQGVILP